VAVSLAPTLSPGALSAAAAAIAESFAGCLASTSPVPAGCPQSLPAQSAGAVSWELVGDPGTGAAFSGVAESDLTAAGSFQMIGTYAVHIPEGVRHQPSSGGYLLSLHWDGHAFSRGALAAADAPPQPRPGVADGTLLDAVAAGFQVCLSSNLLRPADCPQTIPSSLFITRVSWSA